MKTNPLLLAGAILLFSYQIKAQNNTNININTTHDTVNVPPAPAPHDTVVVREVQTVVAAPPPPPSEPAFHAGEFGVRYMPTFTSLRMQNAGGQAVQGNFVVSQGFGAFVGINSKHVGLNLEVIYNSLSQKYSTTDVSHDVKLNYINIPLLITFNTDKSKPVNLSAVIGPQIGINIGSQVNTTGTSNGNDSLQAVVAVKKSDFGFAYGAGIEFALNEARTFRLGIGFRGVFGLVNINDDSGTKMTNQYYILDRTNIETYSGYAGLSIMF